MNFMKNVKLTFVSLVSILAAPSLHAQDGFQFQDLDFEQANPVIDLRSPFYPNGVTASSALPGWTAYLGNVPQTDVLQNRSTIDEASVDIFGPNYPAAEQSPDFIPGTIDGNYSVLLQAGNIPETLTDINASIAQLGFVPATAQSLEFKTYMTPTTEFSVSIDGNSLTPVILGNNANYTLYGINIPSYAGQPIELEFTALFNESGPSWLGLDDIAFSPNVVPEPSMVALSAMGGLLFGARKWFARR
jgi:hypothetical protein